MKMPKIVHVEPPDGPSEHEKLSAENAALMAQAASALGDAEALRTENEALRTHRDQLTEDLGSLEDRMQELLARVASEYRNGHAAGMEAAMESVAALRARVEAEACDACAGTGKTTHGGPCMCGGSGRMADAARYLRARVAVLERALKGLVDAAEDAACDDPDEDAILDDAYCEARRIVYYTEQSPVSAKRAHVASPDCWCKPTLDYRDAETGREHWVHHEQN